MVTFLFYLLKAARPRQWIKNFALLAGLLFSGQLDDTTAIIGALYAFLIFCAASSATYLLNDVFDIERDILHPFKKNRPIASGKISAPIAIIIAFAIIVSILPLAYHLSPAFFFAVLLYLILQLLYSSYLKSIILLDVMTIAAGFVVNDEDAKIRVNW